jgi:phage terminase small subunit
MSKALSTKQQAFVAHYFNCWSATEAARRAGYANPEKNAYRLMVIEGVKAAIAARLAELKMSADEVLTRLTAQARGSIAPFIRRDTDGDLYGFDLSETQPLHLLKKASLTRRRQKDDKDELVTVETVTIELYDAQAALALLGKHHKLFVDRTEITGKGGAPIDVTSANAPATIEPQRRQRERMTEG